MNLKLPKIDWKSLFQVKSIQKKKIKKRTYQKKKKPRTSRVRKKSLLLKNYQKLSPAIREGIDFGNLLTTLWRLQKHPDKVYVEGYRIHHGLAGGLVALAGAYYKDDFLTGLGASVAYDDIKDIDHWLNFEN